MGQLLGKSAINPELTAIDPNKKESMKYKYKSQKNY